MGAEDGNFAIWVSICEMQHGDRCILKEMSS